MEKGYYNNLMGNTLPIKVSQSTIKMEKGYYKQLTDNEGLEILRSQSTIKMEKGYYCKHTFTSPR